MFRSLLRRDFAGLKFKFRFVLSIAHLPEIVDRCTLKGCRNRENLLEQREEEGGEEMCHYEIRCLRLWKIWLHNNRYSWVTSGLQGYKDISRGG